MRGRLLSLGLGVEGQEANVRWPGKQNSQVAPRDVPLSAQNLRLPDRVGVMEWNHMGSEKWKGFSGWCLADVRDWVQE